MLWMHLFFKCTVHYKYKQAKIDKRILTNDKEMINNMRSGSCDTTLEWINIMYTYHPAIHICSDR